MGTAIEQMVSDNELGALNQEACDHGKSSIFKRASDELIELIRNIWRGIATLQDVPAALKSIIDFGEKSSNGFINDPTGRGGQNNICKLLCRDGHAQSDD